MANPIPSDLCAPEGALPHLAPAATCIGHVHLKVADLDRPIAFYRDVLGLELTARYGRQAAFLSVGGYHHHIGLNTWESAGGTPPPSGHTGRYHTAFLYLDRRSLAQALARALRAEMVLDGYADYGVSEAVYFRDPDGNGIELYRDRPQAEWPCAPDGGPAMRNDRLDLHMLLAEA